jgi:hypothetical protein
MGAQPRARNRMKPNLENKFGTNIESLAGFAHEFVGGSGGYDAREFANSARHGSPSTYEEK